MPDLEWKDVLSIFQSVLYVFQIFVLKGSQGIKTVYEDNLMLHILHVTCVRYLQYFIIAKMYCLLLTFLKIWMQFFSIYYLSILWFRYYAFIILLLITTVKLFTLWLVYRLFKDLLEPLKTNSVIIFLVNS